MVTISQLINEEIEKNPILTDEEMLELESGSSEEDEYYMRLLEREIKIIDEVIEKNPHISDNKLLESIIREELKTLLQ